MTAFRRPVVLFTNSRAMGGMEQHVAYLARGCVERGIRTAVVCAPTPEIEPLRSELRGHGVEVHTHTEGSGAGAAARRFGELTALFRDYDGGVLHVHSTGFHGGSLVMLAGRRAGMRGIVRTEHVPPQPPLGRSHRIAVRLRDRLLTSRVICVSNGNREEHVDLLARDRSKIAVVPNGIVVEKFLGCNGTAARAAFASDDQALVGTIGRLDEERKGIAEFIRMAAVVADERSDVRFLVVGDGSLRSSLEQLAAELGVNGQIDFAGARPDVPELLAAMDVFVMPSLWEAGPLTLLEAMAARRPVVTTPVGVAPDIVADEVTGLIVPIGDVPALADAVGRLLGDVDLATRLGRAAEEEARRSFSIDRMVDRTIAVYGAAVGAG